jgi:phosphoglycolate phosphatase-like HAD superfamily hydrolase
VKLDALGLATFFDLEVGGYGSDHVDRHRLVESARERAATKYGPEYGEAGRAIVIGDTPRDIEAARLGGADIVAVASGRHGAVELRAAGAQRVCADLADTAQILRYLLSS